MGLLDNSGDILIDAVLTDVGREFLARNDGSFEVVRFALSDDEIDYSLFNPNTGSLQQDLDIVNTPVFEANVNEKVAVKYRLLSISNPDLKYLPSLNSTVSALSLGERADSQVGQTLEFYQATQSSRNVPSEIVDSTFIVQLDNDLLFIEKQTPTNITSFGTAQFVIPRVGLAANQGAKVTFNVAVQSLTSDVWDTLGSGTAGSRVITTKIKVQGAKSGLSGEVTITINEEFTR